MIYGIAVANSCGICRIDNIIHFLNGFHVRVCPRGLRVRDLLDHKTDEHVAEARPNVVREILESGIDFGPSLDSWEGEHRERVILKLDKRPSV